MNYSIVIKKEIIIAGFAIASLIASCTKESGNDNDNTSEAGKWENFWTPVPSANKIKTLSNSAVLKDGKVLLEGVDAGGMMTYEIFDPAENTVTPINYSQPSIDAGGLGEYNFYGTSSTLNNGNALLTTYRKSSAKLFNPATKTFTSLGPLSFTIGTYSSCQLANGRVIFIGAQSLGVSDQNGAGFKQVQLNLGPDNTNFASLHTVSGTNKFLVIGSSRDNGAALIYSFNSNDDLVKEGIIVDFAALDSRSLDMGDGTLLMYGGRPGAVLSSIYHPKFINPVTKSISRLVCQVFQSGGISVEDSLHIRIEKAIKANDGNFYMMQTNGGITYFKLDKLTKKAIQQPNRINKEYRIPLPLNAEYSHGPLQALKDKDLVMLSDGRVLAFNGGQMWISKFF